MKKLRFLAPAATLLAVFACSPADAGWGSRGYSSFGGSSGSSGSSGYVSYSYGSSGGSYGSYGSSGGSSGGSYGSSGGSRGGGLLGHLHRKIHNHIAVKRARHASSGGSSGYVSYGSSSHGSSGYVSYGSSSHGSSGYSSYGSSGYTTYRARHYHSYASGGSSGGSSGHVTYSYAAPAVSYSAPVVSGSYESGTILDQPYTEGAILDGSGGEAVEGAGEPAPATPAVPAEARIQLDSALITVAVPASARVTVNGHPTTSEGPIRQFMSRGLKEGFTYSYEIEVEGEVNGQPLKETKTLRVRAGDKERVVFNAPASTDVETALTVRVPSDAKVVLAGNLTAAEGETRVFRTHQLSQGEVWDNYEVAVTIVRDGREITKKQVLRLVAGSERELAFDFADQADTASLAVR